MAMEVSRGAQPQAPSATSATLARGKPAPADAAGSFGAVFASVEDASAADARAAADGAAAPADDAARPPGKKALRDTDAAAVAEAPNTASPPAPVDPSALLLAQGALAGAAATVPAAAPEPTAMNVKATAGSKAVAGVGAAPREAAAASWGAVFNANVGSSTQAGPSKTALAHDAAALSAEPAAPAATPSSAMTAATAAAQADAKASAQAAATTKVTVDGAAAIAMPAIVSEVAGATPATWRRIERANDSSAVHTGQASGIDATTATQPLVAPPDAAGATAHGAGAGMMERMVEQVSWWMAQGHQGAELKVELPGGAPVSVSVQVQGNEAQVAFRSDHPAARQWLGDAMPQLRQMLGNEGLMLSGASVGGSDAGAPQDNAPDARRTSHATTGIGGAATVEAATRAAVRPGVAVQRALDLYV